MLLRNLLLLALLIPTSAWALGSPLETPANPSVPLGPVDRPVDRGWRPEAPPLELNLPGPPANPGPWNLQLGGAPDPLPIPVTPVGPPDLTGVVWLPPGASRVFDLAPPFGGGPATGGGGNEVVPEPGTALLLGLGLGAIAVSRRR
jgi:hypothetical protein